MFHLSICDNIDWEMFERSNRSVYHKILLFDSEFFPFIEQDEGFRSFTVLSFT